MSHHHFRLSYLTYIINGFHWIWQFFKLTRASIERFDGRIQYDIDSNDDRNNVINWGLNDDWLIIYQYTDAFIDDTYRLFLASHFYSCFYDWGGKCLPMGIWIITKNLINWYKTKVTPPHTSVELSTFSFLHAYALI